MGKRLKGAARQLAALEPLFVVLAAPFLLFPAFRPSWTAGALVMLALVWLLRWIGYGRPGTRTPLDVSLLLLMLMVPIGVWASPLPELTLPKLTGLILGVAAFRATVNAGQGPRNLGRAAAFYLAMGLGLVGVGLLGTTWSGKLPALAGLLERIPLLIQGLPGAEAGINPNELGWTVLLFLPMSLASCVAGGARAGRADAAKRLVALLLTLFFVVVLLLTQSRSAWLGAAVGVAVMAWLRWRWVGWVMLFALVVLAVGFLFVGPQEAAESLFRPASAVGTETVIGTFDLAGRVELWNRALYGIQDFPFTGVGLGAFRGVVHVLYPLFLRRPEIDVGHAHSVFLQAALDLGIPGLIAYLALVGTALWIGWRVARFRGRGRLGMNGSYQWLAFGIVGSLVALHVYGLTDTFPLGAKPGVAFWMLLALTAVLWSTSLDIAQSHDAAESKRAKDDTIWSGAGPGRPMDRKADD